MANIHSGYSSFVLLLQRFFLQGSAFKLFLVLFIIPFIVEIVATILVEQFQNFNTIPNLLLESLVMEIFTVLFIIWLYMLGENLYIKLPVEGKIGIKFFKFNLSYIIAYSVIFFFFWLKIIPINFDLLGIFHVYYMFCVIYSFYFVSKTLVSVEKQKIANFNEFSGAFFMLLLLPLGIWWIQPRISKIFKSKYSS